MSSARNTPVDQPVRDRLVAEFDRNFLVEAGAGSGKTHSLATRMAAGVAAGIYTVERMAVVTFTRKAAAELRGRFQLALEDRRRAQPSDDERGRLEAALSGMERLTAGTIHSFCARLLRERPVDARIAPGFEELSDIDNLHRQRRAWRDFVAAAVGGGFAPVLDLLEAGIRPKELDEAFATVCEHEDVEFDMGSGEPPDSQPVWGAIDAFWAQLSTLRPQQFHEKTTCGVQSKWDDFEGWLVTARRGRLSSLAALLRAWGKPVVTQKYWDKEVGRPAGIGKQVKQLVDDFQAQVVEPFQVQWMAYVHHLAMQVLVEGRRFFAAERRRQNVANYVDLLTVTADTLRRCADVRHALQEKYRFLFIDEFQDTDPIQAEIFLMLAADETRLVGPERGSTGEAAIDPFAAPLRPGALFVVGDPKQSIFRFRRADIDIYNRVADRIRTTGGDVVTLTANFRSLPAVCHVANQVFPPLFAGQAAPYSPQFAGLDPVREDTSAVARTGVLTVPTADDDVPHEVREAERIAAYVESEVAAGRRTYGDFLVLTRQTTRLGIFVEAFDARQIPVDVSGAGLFCQSPEVQVLALLLAALADPLDSVALVGVLRGSLFGHSDPELFRYHQAGGRFELMLPLPEAQEDEESAALDTRYGSVLASMRRLRGMWQQTRSLPTAAAVERILDDTGWLALAATSPGGARAGHLLQAIDRVRQIVDEGGGLAEAADALNEVERSSEAEAMPLEPGRRNVVRLMNLHKAKGLEADVVFLADAAHQFAFPIALRVVRDGNGGPPVGHLRIMRPADEPWKSRPLAQPTDWEEHEHEEKRYRDAERIRLLYVAGTRARDLLVLCRSSEPKNNKAWDVFAGCFADAPELVIPRFEEEQSESPSPIAADETAASLPAFASRLAARHDAAGRASWTVTAVTTNKAIERKARVDRAALSAEDDGSRRIDAGAAWGSLVHGLLEHAMRFPTATRADLLRLARWLIVDSPHLAPVADEAVDVAERVSKLALLQHARDGAELHVEAPFGLRVDAPASPAPGVLPAPVPAVVRGVIDLAYRTADGWHIVDYKTDLASDEAVLKERYIGQLGQYATAWARVTGSSVVSTRIVSTRAASNRS